MFHSEGRTSIAHSLRDRLDRVEQEGPLCVPGAYDALSASLVERAGHDAIYMTGFGAAASLLGAPDIGLLSASEMADQARRIVAATRVPVIADADTGYGNALNVIRTVQEYERAGVAAIQLEDQVTPKRCGHMEDKQVISTAEMTAKLEAARGALAHDDTILIARTDAVATSGLEEAIDRARAYRASGADLLFIEAPPSVEAIEAIASELSDIPLVFNWAEGGKTPLLSYDRIAELGFSMIILPIGTLLAAARGVEEFLARFEKGETPVGKLDDLPTFDDMTGIVGLPHANSTARRYAGD